MEIKLALKVNDKDNVATIAFTQILPYAVYDIKYLTSRLRRIFCLFGSTGSIIKAP